MKSDKEEKIQRKLEREERKDFHVKREKEQEDIYDDLPAHIFHKIYRSQT